MDEVTLEVRFFKYHVRIWFATPDLATPSQVKGRLAKFAPKVKTRLIAGDYDGDLVGLLDELGQIPGIRAAQVLVEDADDPDIKYGFLRHYIWP